MHHLTHAHFAIKITSQNKQKDNIGVIILELEVVVVVSVVVVDLSLSHVQVGTFFSVVIVAFGLLIVSFPWGNVAEVPLAIAVLIVDEIGGDMVVGDLVEIGHKVLVNFVVVVIVEVVFKVMPD